MLVSCAHMGRSDESAWLRAWQSGAVDEHDPSVSIEPNELTLASVATLGLPELLELHDVLLNRYRPWAPILERRGASLSALSDLAPCFGGELPLEVRQLYAWRDGNPRRERGLLSDGQSIYLLSIQDVLVEGMEATGQVPFLSSSDGKCRRYLRPDGESPIVVDEKNRPVWGSITALVRSVVAQWVMLLRGTQTSGQRRVLLQACCGMGHFELDHLSMGGSLEPHALSRQLMGGWTELNSSPNRKGLANLEQNLRAAITADPTTTAWALGELCCATLMACGAGWVERGEAWLKVVQATGAMQSHYASWHQYIEAYLAGRREQRGYDEQFEVRSRGYAIEGGLLNEATWAQPLDETPPDEPVLDEVRVGAGSEVTVDALVGERLALRRIRLCTGVHEIHEGRIAGPLELVGEPGSSLRHGGSVALIVDNTSVFLEGLRIESVGIALQLQARGWVRARGCVLTGGSQGVQAFGGTWLRAERCKFEGQRAGHFGQSHAELQGCELVGFWALRLRGGASVVATDCELRGGDYAAKVGQSVLCAAHSHFEAHVTAVALVEDRGSRFEHCVMRGGHFAVNCVGVDDEDECDPRLAPNPYQSLEGWPSVHRSNLEGLSPEGGAAVRVADAGGLCFDGCQISAPMNAVYASNQAQVLMVATQCRGALWSVGASAVWGRELQVVGAEGQVLHVRDKGRLRLWKSHLKEGHDASIVVVEGLVQLCEVEVGPVDGHALFVHPGGHALLRGTTIQGCGASAVVGQQNTWIVLDRVTLGNAGADAVYSEGHLAAFDVTVEGEVAGRAFSVTETGSAVLARCHAPTADAGFQLDSDSCSVVPCMGSGVHQLRGQLAAQPPSWLEQDALGLVIRTPMLEVFLRHFEQPISLVMVQMVTAQRPCLADEVRCWVDGGELHITVGPQYTTAELLEVFAEAVAAPGWLQFADVATLPPMPAYLHNPELARSIVKWAGLVPMLSNRELLRAITQAARCGVVPNLGEALRMAD